jgi:hypothetical protein
MAVPPHPVPHRCGSVVTGKSGVKGFLKIYRNPGYLNYHSSAGCKVHEITWICSFSLYSGEPPLTIITINSLTFCSGKKLE